MVFIHLKYYREAKKSLY